MPTFDDIDAKMLPVERLKDLTSLRLDFNLQLMRCMEKSESWITPSDFLQEWHFTTRTSCTVPLLPWRGR